MALGSLFFRYWCKDSTKMVVYKNDPSFYEKSLNIECLYNGKWSDNIDEFGCTKCEKLKNPANGNWDCQSFFFDEESYCTLVN